MAAAGKKNVLIIELNEFNVELLKAATTTYALPTLSKVLNMPQTSYRTNDRYNSGYLEPWVQWVSIHSGIPSAKHKIKHLGDVPDLAFAQCWEVLSQHNISTGVWGVMNGARQTADNVAFFLPDPWTFSEKAYPPKLNHLLDLPRYVSKNYQHMNPLKVLGHGIKLIKCILSSGSGRKILAESARLLASLCKNGPKHYLFIAYFDFVSTLLFAQYKKNYNPQCSILFLNSLAHLQHHHWREGTTTVTPEILYGLRYLDQMFALLFKTFPEDAFVIHNGLSQMNTNHEKAWVLYRQKDPKAFLKAMGIRFTHIEQHMTHDGHIFFATTKECEQAYELIKTAKIHGKRLFQVERNAHDACKLFYMLNFTDAVDKSEKVDFEFGEKHYRFYDYFDRIVTRTGRHSPIGTIFSDTIEFADQIYNHDFNTYLYHYLKPEQFKLRETREEELYAEESVSEPA